MNFLNKKVLIIGSKEKFSLEKMYYRAFKKLKISVKFYHTENTVKKKFDLLGKKLFPDIINYFIRKDLSLYLNKNRQYDLIIIFKGLYLKSGFIKRIKKKSPKTKIINIFPDDPFNFKKNISNKNFLNCIKEFDFFCIWSQKILLKLMKISNKKKLIYLPFGYDEFLHKKVKKIKKYSNSINFVGSYDQKRFNLINSLDKRNLVLAGNNWNKKIFNDIKPLFDNKLCSLISSSLISINILRDQNKTSHNMRTFEIPAMGGLMLTTRSKEQNYFFKENKECIMFSGKKELNKKINYLLKNIKRISLIKKNAYIKSKKNSYTNRSRYLLKKIFINEKVF